jgi:hypothetical protein
VTQRRREQPVALVLACTDRSGRDLVVRAGTATLFRVLTVLPSAGQVGLSGLRALLVADLLTRVVEDWHGGQVLHAVLTRGPQLTDLRDIVGTFGVRHPTAIPGSAAEAVVELGGPARLTILAAGSAAPHDADVEVDVGCYLEVGGTPANGPAGEGGPAAVRRLLEEVDPLAVRLALLRGGHRRPLMLADPVRKQAAATVDRWRRHVAAWAASPSRPMPDGMQQLLRGALGDDLDVGAALLVLHRLEDDADIAPGAKFETFLYADRVLGLDLARDLARAGRGHG